MLSMMIPWLVIQPTIQSAQQLLGMQLSLAGCSGLIVETEAYLGVEDKAAHAFGGRKTPRNHSLYLPAGNVYVYQMRQYCLLNIVTRTAEVPECILIRALEPQAGMAKMQQRRHQEGVGLTNGPGKLCQALAIDRALDGSRLNAGGLQLTATTFQPRHITIGPRIGIPNKEPWTSAPLCFSVQGNPFVSGTARRDQDLKTRGWQS